MLETPSYIRNLLMPNGKKPAGRKVWSVDLETVWLPFFTATNAMGETHIAHDAIGAPLRLALDSDGAVKFSKSGRPVTKVAKELGDSIRLVRENFVAELRSYAGAVIADNPEGYKAEVELAQQEGEPIIANDRARLEEIAMKQMEQAIAEAEAKGKHKGKSKVEPAKVEATV